jgi:hypothetical protein
MDAAKAGGPGVGDWRGDAIELAAHERLQLLDETSA